MSQTLFRLLGPISRQQKHASLLLFSKVFFASNTKQVLATSSALFSGQQGRNQYQHRFFTSGRISLKSTPGDLEGQNESEDDDDLIENADDDQDKDEVSYLSTSNPRWLEAGMNPAIIKLLNRNGITEFTPVQAEAFEPVLSGRDVIGRSRTGTGKTLAFGIPAMTRLVGLAEEKGIRNSSNGRMKKGRKPSMIILCPTRELARQVGDELRIYADPLGLDIAYFHGGVSYNPQIDALYGGLDVLVGTPGRIYDHMQSGALSLDECNIAVLDEADQMLNMGFSDQVEKIFEGMGKANKEKTQVLLFSATTPGWVTEMGKRYQRDVYSIDSTRDEGGARVANTVSHKAVLVPHNYLRTSILEDIIVTELNLHGEGKGRKTMIFSNTKREADALASATAFRTLKAQSLHGDHSQRQRDDTLDKFRRGAFDVLVATDVAARGLDIKEVDLIVQLGPPMTADAYVHRSGRTGRAGASGVSILLFTADQRGDLKFIERDLGHGFAFELKKPPSFEESIQMAAKTSAATISEADPKTTALFREAAEQILSDSNDPADVVARCLAVMNKRPAIEEDFFGSGSESDAMSWDQYKSGGRGRGGDRRGGSYGQVRDGGGSGGYGRGSYGRGGSGYNPRSSHESHPRRNDDRYKGSSGTQRYESPYSGRRNSNKSRLADDPNILFG